MDSQRGPLDCCLLCCGVLLQCSTLLLRQDLAVQHPVFFFSGSYVRHGPPCHSRATMAFASLSFTSFCFVSLLLQLAENLRKRPYHVNVLLGGYDDTGASLHWMDYLGTLQKMNYGAHGHCSNFIISTMDRYWKVRTRRMQGGWVGWRGGEKGIMTAFVCPWHIPDCVPTSSLLLCVCCVGRLA